MTTGKLARMDLGSLAALLYASPLQPSESPTPAVVKNAVTRQFCRCHGDVSVCVRQLAQDAGDHPDLCAPRMRWARQAVGLAYECRQPTRPTSCPGVAVIGGGRGRLFPGAGPDPASFTTGRAQLNIPAISTPYLVIGTGRLPALAWLAYRLKRARHRSPPAAWGTGARPGRLEGLSRMHDGLHDENEVPLG
jgi:hypothetical protein